MSGNKQYMHVQGVDEPGLDLASCRQEALSFECDEDDQQP